MAGRANCARHVAIARSTGTSRPELWRSRTTTRAELAQVVPSARHPCGVGLQEALLDG